LATRDDYILALLKVAEEEKAEVTATKFQKIFFLLEKEGGVNLNIEFEPWLFGPYSRELDNALNELIKEGKVKVEREDVVEPLTGLVMGYRKVYYIEDSDNIPIKIDNKVIDFFRKWVKESLWNILGYVYKNYPDYTIKSTIKEKIMPH